MRNYLNSLNEREKWMLIATILFVAGYFYYLFLYAPLSSRVSQKSAQLIEKSQTLSWMKQIKDKAHATKKKQTLDNSQLLTVLAAQLKQNTQLQFPYQLQQTGSGDIQLTFDAVPFNLLVKWLSTVNEHYALQIKQFEASLTEKPGVTKLSIILSAV